jgi:CBS domain-containing protein
MSVAKTEPIRDLIQRPTLFVHLDDSLRRLATTFAEESVGAAVVRDTHPPALVSERDVVNALAEGADPDQASAREIMTEDLVVAAPTDAVLDVATRMLENEVRHVPIIEDNVIVGVVSSRDLLRACTEELLEL